MRTKGTPRVGVVDKHPILCVKNLLDQQLEKLPNLELVLVRYIYLENKIYLSLHLIHSLMHVFYFKGNLTTEEVVLEWLKQLKESDKIEMVSDEVVELMIDKCDFLAVLFCEYYFHAMIPQLTFCYLILPNLLVFIKMFCQNVLLFCMLSEGLQ